jgi:hypothetical protein
MVMGFPIIPFRLCDFEAIYTEKFTGNILQVRGALPRGGIAIAKFRKQTAPKGSWCAYSLEEVKE